MSGHSLPNHVVIDGFLPEDAAQALLDHALGNEALFAPATVYQTGEHDVMTDLRQAQLTRNLGEAGPLFTAAVEAHVDHLCKACGIAPFAISGWELEMVAHRDGGFFVEHIDTKVAANRQQAFGDRVLSIVYYLHRQDAAFTGGELVLKPFLGDGETRHIAPEHNRLVAFSSIARHQVETIRVPGDRWEDARFSINCWLLRASQD